jgi:hypothetical protein
MRNQIETYKGYSIIALVILFFAPVAFPKYSGGYGSPEKPYCIATPNDLNSIGSNLSDWGAHFLMVNDINLAEYTGSTFSIIGTSSDDPFTGTFDGNDHQISNFTYTSSGIDYIGLFGCIDGAQAKVKDLCLSDPNINGGTNSDYVGALVGHLRNGQVSGCRLVNGSVSGNIFVGGLIGNSGGHITNCYSACSVVAVQRSGVLVGRNFQGTVSNCYSSGSITGTGYYSIGGLAGENISGLVTNSYSNCDVSGIYLVGGLIGTDAGGTVTLCYSNADVEGTGNVGGLIGLTTSQNIKNCFSLGNATGTTGVGGLIGENDGAIVKNCYSTTNISGTSYVGGFLGIHLNGAYEKCFWDNDLSPEVNGIGNITDPNVIAKSTAEMYTKSTYTDSGWDFLNETANGNNDIWRMCFDDIAYPKLTWQFTRSADFLCPDGTEFIDYSFFANHWLLTNCPDTNDCNSTDLDFSGAVNADDLDFFNHYWLFGKQ